MRREKIMFLLSAIVSIFFLGKAFAWTGGSTGICSDEHGNNFPCSDGSSGGGSSDSDTGWSPWRSGSSSSGGGYRERGPSIWEIRRQERAEASAAANEIGNQCFSQRDYDCAVSNYEEALRLNSGNATARDNLRLAKARRANKLAVEYYNQENWKLAVKYFQEALSFEEQQQYRDNLASSQEYLNAQLREEKLAQAKINVDKVLDETASTFGMQRPSKATANMEFIGEKESLYSKGDKDSTVVDLTFMEPAKPMATEPMAVGQKQEEKGVKFKDVPAPLPPVKVKQEDLPLFARNRPTLVLDAIKKGNGNWDASVKYLDDYLLAEKNPELPNVQEAVSYLEGIRDAEKTMQKASGKPSSSKEDDSVIEDAIMEVAAKRFSDKPKQPEWPGPINTKPESKIPNPLSWKEERDQLVVEALVQGGGDMEKSISYLEKKAKTEARSASGDLGLRDRQAIQYLEGLCTYKDYAEEQAKKTNKR